MPLSQVQPQKYEALLAEKVTTVSALLTPYDAPAPRIFRSEPTGFRLRAEFRVWHDGDALDYVMFRRDDPKTPVPIQDFPIADTHIQALMPVLVERVKAHTELRRKLFQVEFLATLSGDMLVTLVYHRKLEQDWEALATQLRDDLQADFPGLSIIGRSRRQKVILGRDHVTEVLPIEGRDYRYQQFEQAFTQPNGRVNIQMIEWACEQARDCPGDMLELYCGNGNFTLPLSRHFENVIATELSKTSVKAARQNLVDNSIDNIQLVRLSAEEVTQAMNGEREFRRLRELPQPLADYDLRTVFVDPPRAGLDEHTVGMVAGFDTVLYVSCNPETLAANLESLCRTHRIASFALFDQFPYTHHMECGVRLVRREDTVGQASG